MTNNYSAAYKKSLDEPETFWSEAAEDVHWYKRWAKVLDVSTPPLYRWFPGGELNTCYNALDRHIDSGDGDRIALIYDSPVTGCKVRKFTYLELCNEVALFAGALKAEGVNKGDRVIIYMPMVPEAVIAILACARIGAVHSVVFGGFAANELAVRIDDAKPKVIVSATCGIETSRIIEYLPLLKEAIHLANYKPEKSIVLQRPELEAELPNSDYLDWETVVKKAKPADCVPVASTDPLYILYTSGTTGEPKGVVRDNGGHLVALKWSMKHIYDVNPGEIYWAASDVGWVVGHSYIVYAPLFHGCSTILYEGKPVGTPDAGAFWRVIAEHRVNVLFTAPTAFRAIKKEDPKGNLLKAYDLSSLRSLFLAGERTDPDTLYWAQNLLDIPVIDHWWQTESGWAMASNCMGLGMLSVKPGSPTKPVPGWDIRVLGNDCEELQPGEVGAVCIKLPMPPSSLLTLWNAEARFIESYFSTFKGYYETSDAGYIDQDGYIFVMGRTDDIINVAGHRLSTGAIEEVLAAHPDVAECAVIGVADQLKGQLPVGLLVLKSGVTKDSNLITLEVVKMVREKIGPVASFKKAIIVGRLPKTRSGKILRGTMQKIADCEDWRMPATIDDPVILDEIGERLKAIGYAKSP
ncbi:MAG: Acetyl-coenzyme A synthetase [Alphaproteobacteria bacterium MarineAlpha3_Bin5]|nr:MAG: Acetyl-coenzyme A synthetase [Alphaproteobacteria bacterium MarineAlpha3_Bin5]